MKRHLRNTLSAPPTAESFILYAFRDEAREDDIQMLDILRCDTNAYLLNAPHSMASFRPSLPLPLRVSRMNTNDGEEKHQENS